MNSDSEIPAVRTECLKLLSDIQSDEIDTGSARGTNSIQVEIGHVDKESDMVRHDSLYIKDAPAVVIETLRNKGYSLSVTETKSGTGVKVNLRTYDS